MERETALALQETRVLIPKHSNDQYSLLHFVIFASLQKAVAQAYVSSVGKNGERCLK